MPSKKNTTGSEIASLDMEDKGNTLSRRAVLQKGAKLAAAAAVPSLVGLGSLTTSTPASAWGPIRRSRLLKSELPADHQEIITNGTGLPGCRVFNLEWTHYEITWKYDSASTGHVLVTQNIIQRDYDPYVGDTETIMDSWTMDFYEKTGELTNKSKKTLDLSDTKPIIFKNTFTLDGLGNEIKLKPESDRRKLEAFYFSASMKWLQTYMFYIRQGYKSNREYSGIFEQGLAIVQYSLRHPRTGQTRIMYLYGTRKVIKNSREEMERVDTFYESLDEPSGMAGPSASLRIIAGDIKDFAGVTCINSATCLGSAVSTTLGIGWFDISQDYLNPLVWTNGAINLVGGLISGYYQNMALQNGNNLNMNASSSTGRGQLKTMENQGYLREVDNSDNYDTYAPNEWYRTPIRAPLSWYENPTGLPIMPADWRTPTPSPGHGGIWPADNEWGIQPLSTHLRPFFILNTESPHTAYMVFEDKSYVPPNPFNGPFLANVEL